MGVVAAGAMMLTEGAGAETPTFERLDRAFWTARKLAPSRSAITSSMVAGGKSTSCSSPNCESSETSAP